MAEPTKIEKPSAKLKANPYDDPNHPMYLHHSDQPGAILVPQPLNEENYETWSRAMTMALSAKNKEGFIDGSISRPNKSSTFELKDTIDACQKLKKGKEKDDAQDRRTSKTYHVQAKETPSSQSSSINLIAKQYQNLLALLGNNKSPTMANLIGDVFSINNLPGKSLRGITLWKNRAWILDSGETDHIVCSSNMFTICLPVQNWTVNLPNGMAVAVTHIGSIRFSPNLILHNVLCVPSFQLNLISVSKLVKHSDYIAIFAEDLFVLQDLCLGMMIGTGTEQGDFTISPSKMTR
ncbi:uncharacterized protein LOC126584269 [Malus sylvestris]|uniref:uncharacterized protein LOC126584269 n=1 Tax=Malus sylvestris TaxID=3752 RepID=UPI0021AC8B82|nr:uncharacterized protein LOC126584269 [Malus sylvestris]